KKKLTYSYLFRVVVADAIFIALILGAAIWMLPKADMKVVSAAQSPLWGYDASSSTEYFPAQYRNQATEIPEHIQAF
ncbi:MAG: hypothetical protein Q8L40_02100, partial [Burkholderiales bacterium]|nr:hypothetical protein [Burkholderiales bacterium]